MRLPITLLVIASFCTAATPPRESRYYWEATAIGDTADLVTLFCRSCYVEAGAERDIPLVAVLRDTLGDSDSESDRISCVWLLPYSRIGAKQNILSAVPFFWRHVSQGAGDGIQNAPITDLTRPEHPTLAALGRTLLQWIVLDRNTMPLRAVSRAYRANQLDNERLHLEEAITYLDAAPVSESRSALTQKQVDTIVARLELRKHLLGGLVAESRATHIGEESEFERKHVRSRNWELLRQCADKTGLLFEPLDIAGTASDYAMLWFPLNPMPKPDGSSLDSIWKLLNIKDPWGDQRLQQWKGITFSRSLDGNGSLLSAGASGVKQLRLVPLCIYSMTYSKMPLLLIDFRDKLHVRKHELAQRAITEITAGVIGISHFTNWYYYLGLSVYEFVAARHGSAVDQSARLDSYAQFRVELALDQELDAALRKEMESRVESIIVNPLIEPASREMQVAAEHYAALRAETEANGGVRAELDEERRSEIASFGETTRKRLAESLLHEVTFGLYRRRADSDAGDVAKLNRYRRVEYQLNFLNEVVETGSRPEITYEGALLRASVAELSSLMTGVKSSEMRAHAAATLKRIGDLSMDPELQAGCRFAVTSLEGSARRSDKRSGAVASTRVTSNRPYSKKAESIE